LVARIKEPHLSSDRTYIVMEMPITQLGSLMDILRNEKPLQIRYSKFGNGPAVAFLEGTDAHPLSVENQREIFGR
jgi:hypothetical protein